MKNNNTNIVKDLKNLLNEYVTEASSREFIIKLREDRQLTLWRILFLRVIALSKLQSLQNLKMLKTLLLDIQRNQAKEKS